MQFKIRFHLPSPLKLPLGYHPYLQGLIYHILGESPAYSTFLHDYGYEADGKNYKLFVFSLLQGEYTISGGSITFHNEVSFEVRSPIGEFCDVFYYALMHRQSFEIGHQPLDLIDCTVSRFGIASRRIHIDMLSPLCLSKVTSGADGSPRSDYIAPTDPEFNSLLQTNFERKLESSFGRYPAGRITLTPDRLVHGEMQRRDKYVTHFKDTLVVAWRGRYTLTGNPSDLSFLLDAGLGSRNSQGFGMFRVI